MTTGNGFVNLTEDSINEYQSLIVSLPESNLLDVPALGVHSVSVFHQLHCIDIWTTAWSICVSLLCVQAISTSNQPSRQQMVWSVSLAGEELTNVKTGPRCMTLSRSSISAIAIATDGAKKKSMAETSGEADMQNTIPKGFRESFGCSSTLLRRVGI
ncbi:hypothetical protein K402DRAFT_439474 [Aulographum hederae CBS 113979]|uniref:Uncharacterized protein n=1 Tax=Aulographum hederae CBS 113979 TaxID=1176131 RepID=A0A6G1GLV2_9PEZI|nr:hypothetical protein K402DRAFT_439474 [Aulographum hederae CBS 113979]